MQKFRISFCGLHINLQPLLLVSQGCWSTHTVALTSELINFLAIPRIAGIGTFGWRYGMNHSACGGPVRKDSKRIHYLTYPRKSTSLENGDGGQYHSPFYYRLYDVLCFLWHTDSAQVSSHSSSLLVDQCYRSKLPYLLYLARQCAKGYYCPSYLTPQLDAPPGTIWPMKPHVKADGMLHRFSEDSSMIMNVLCWGHTPLVAPSHFHGYFYCSFLFDFNYAVVDSSWH